MHVQILSNKGNSPRNRGEKGNVKPRSTHIDENWGRQAQTAKSTGTTTSTWRKKSSHSGHQAAPNRGKQVGQTCPPQLWHFSAGGTWVSFPHLVHLMSTGSIGSKCSSETRRYLSPLFMNQQDKFFIRNHSFDRIGV